MSDNNGPKKSFTKSLGTHGVWLGIFALLLLVIALGFSVYGIWNHKESPPARPGVPARIQHSSLKLRADRSGKQWKVSWDPHSPAFNHAKNTKLIIEDGTEVTAQSLSTTEISNGFTMYSPRTNDVVFQLEVFDQEDNQTSGFLRLVRFWRNKQQTEEETCEEVSGPDGALVTTCPQAPATLKSTPSAGSIEAVPPAAPTEPAPPPKPSGADPVETRDRTVRTRPALHEDARRPSEPPEPPTTAQIPVKPSEDSEAHPGKLKRVFGIFPKAGRSIGHLFRNKKPKPTP